MVSEFVKYIGVIYGTKKRAPIILDALMAHHTLITRNGTTWINMGNTLL
jgi:hypothetical protein